jgi:hypothetical protein
MSLIWTYFLVIPFRSIYEYLSQEYTYCTYDRIPYVLPYAYLPMLITSIHFKLQNKEFNFIVLEFKKSIVELGLVDVGNKMSSH